MTDAVYVGLAATSHNASRTTTAVMDNFTVKATQGLPNQPPTVALTQPASGASYAAPASIAIAATASDPESRLSRVEFFSNNARIGTDTTAPYSMTWSPVAAGTYTLTATAFDADGGSAMS
jgi:chitinase